LTNLFKYEIPERYATDFRQTCSLTNVRQIRWLATTLLMIACAVRVMSWFFYKDVVIMPRYAEYSTGNILQICGSVVFALISTRMMRDKSSVLQRNLLTMAFAMFILGVTFLISYIYSQHNTKNTLTVFLTGIVLVSMFFALQTRQVVLLCIWIMVLFFAGMTGADLDTGQKVFNMAAAIILASVLFICSRYSYYFKSEHFIQLRLLEEKNNQINDLNRQKGEILGFVAHDLRAPINNIEALGELLIAEETQETALTPLKMMVSSAKQAKNIINDLIEVIREEKKPMPVEKTDMIPYLKSLCRDWETNTSSARKIDLFTERHSLYANINSSKFTRVLDNLIANGLKFSPRNSPMHITASADQNLCIIEVRDFGIGIPEHLQDKLFDQFSKAGRPGLKGERSIGLGLHISKNIITDHGGDLTVKSQENIGTTFTISLPLCMEDEHLLASSN